MAVKLRQIILLTLLFAAAMNGVTSCSGKTPDFSLKIDSVKSYRDIPGVTNEEITAIEALRSTRQSFSFGAIPSTEAFTLEDGAHAGFVTKFCELLSGLFGIPFNQEFYTWDSLMHGIDNKTIDFTGELTPTSRRKHVYFMSYPIAERTLSVFSKRDAIRIEEESDLNGLRIGFFEGTITAQSIHDAYPYLDFETVLINDTSDAPALIETGIIDAYIIDAVESYTFASYPFIRAKELFQLVYTPVSLTTRNPELDLVISVLDKYIAAGGIDKLFVLYEEGKYEYAKYEFRKTLTNEERIHLERLTAQTVPIVLENDHYPISFYNEKDNEFQGIAVDVLNEISELTDITFETVNNKKAQWGIILDMLVKGEAALISQLLYSAERSGHFIWSLPYASSHYALLSKLEYPYLEMHQVVRAAVGVGKGSAYEDLFHRWFPGHTNLKFYDSQNEGLDALERGDIDLFMASEHVLLDQTSYREKPGYKANVVFYSPLEESLFGFNKNEEVLCSIIKKAQVYTNAAKIENSWANRVYDYSRKMIRERSIYLAISACILFLAFGIVLFLFIKNSRVKKHFQNLAITHSAMYRAIPDLVYCMDTNYRFTNCNRSYEEFTGLSEADVVGKTDLEIYANSPDQKLVQGFMEMNKKVIKEGKTITIEEIHIRPGETSILLKSTKTPLIQNGKIIGLLGISRDITEYRAAEKAAQEASRAKSNFLAKMSHEIRTPMNAIIGMTELALREKEMSAAHKHILTVKQAGAHLLSIINDILDFSKIEMGKLEILPGDYSFSSLINDVIGIIRMRVIDSQIRFAVNIDCNIPDAMIGDETRIRQVLLNVLNNAVKYTEKGFVSFTVKGEKIAEDVIGLHMEIMDSGKGIKPENIKNLFGEYTQFDIESNRGIEGVGLGLAISWNIVKAMGGDISVYSEYGKGSTFTVTLPQRVLSGEVLAVVENREEKSVVVYERREIYANSIMSSIDNLGVKCTLVSTDAELREKMSEWQYKFIFISYTLLEKNRNTISEFGADARIIILTEFGESIPDKKLSVLAMPVYSITLASIFNGMADSFNYSNDGGHIARFIAPTAKVLVVDDINTNLKVAEGLMLPYKMQVDLCQSGRDAIEAVNSKRYDLIFMDHKMPEMDGITATSHIRAFEEKDQYYKTVPIIALTANAVAGTKEMFLNSGFNDFLSKPIDTVKLNFILEKWIPREKQKNIQDDYWDDSVIEESENNKTITIAGVDIKRGIFLSGGTIKLYLDTLAIFHRDCLRKTEELAKCLETSDFSLFTIHIHALKSALANIGAGELSETARDLENGGEKRDFHFIDGNFGGFISALELLLQNINNVLLEHKEERDEGKTVFDRELFKTELLKLFEALKSFDAGIINNTIDSLRTMQKPEDNEVIMQSISEKILICEYDEAMEMIKKLLTEI